MSPLNEEAQALYRNPVALLFSAHGMKEIADEQMHSLGSLLGAYWTREQVEALFTTSAPGQHRRIPQELITPVTMMLSEGRMTEWLKKQFGAPLGIAPPDWFKRQHDEVVEGFEMDREDFIRMAGMFTPLIPRGK